ncbi:MAG TPA: FtsX-like permease family protein [Chryseolinea sp.]|nr:FtsX-like permease family protein [Chryseolinea sp.]
MLRNLLIVSLRNLLHNRTYTILHIVGLTLGITCTMLISIYILDEVSYDDFHANKKRIHRIITTIQEGAKENFYTSTQVLMSVELETKYTQVENAVRFLSAGRELFENPEHNLKFYEEKFYFTDASVFHVFTFPLIAGDPAKALEQPNTAILTMATAQRYFGTADAMGKTFVSKGKIYTVTGIAAAPPANSSIQFDGLLSFTTFKSDFGSWDSWYPDTYVLIAEDRTVTDVETALDAITRQHVTPLFKNYGITVKYWLQPITDIHLKSDFAEGGGAYDYIYIFLAIAAFVILIACINYINLATARASRRAKEIGIRKTIGSTRGDIIVQFIAESMMLTFASVLVSILLILILLPYFNALAGKSISFPFLLQPRIILGSLLLALMAGVIGGSYPAFYLSHFNPALVLKGSISSGTANVRLRKVLVAVQFAISIAMLICTSVVHDQLQYMRNKDLGFKGAQVLHVELADSATMANESILYDKLKAHTQIVDMASSSSVPGKGIDYTLMKVESQEGMVSKGVYYHYAGYDFVQTMGLALAKGRGFSRDFVSDSTAALVNEAMVKSMKWDDPIGKRIAEDDGNAATTDRVYRVVGVIKDYHQSSLHSPITPLTIFFKEPNYFLNVKIQANDIKGTIAVISDTWRDVTDGKPFSYSFLDADYQLQYQADEKRGQIFTLFSIICLIISCVGLFGLAAFTTEQRAKEIGIRKVVGASVPRIVRLFYSDFLKLIIAGLIVAVPASYFIMDTWLETFAYKTGWHWITFVGSAGITFVVTMGAISFHTIRAAMMNPAVTLRRDA